MIPIDDPLYMANVNLAILSTKLRQTTLEQPSDIPPIITLLNSMIAATYNLYTQSNLTELPGQNTHIDERAAEIHELLTTINSTTLNYTFTINANIQDTNDLAELIDSTAAYLNTLITHHKTLQNLEE